MKLFRDKKTSEIFMQLNEIQVMSLHDNSIHDLSLLDLECVDVSPKNPTLYEVDTIKRERFSLGRLQEHEWVLKEVVMIPVDGKPIPFRVEHITDEKVYLVAAGIIGESSMNDMNEYLDNFMNRLPKDFLDICSVIEHKVNGATIRSSKVTLLSHGNLTGCEYCNGTDDMQFDGLKTEADRCKNNTDGETRWYWQDTPYNYKDFDGSALASNSPYFLGVYYTGYPTGTSYAGNTYGVCPCLSIYKRIASNRQ